MLRDIVGYLLAAYFFLCSALIASPLVLWGVCLAATAGLPPVAQFCGVAGGRLVMAGVVFGIPLGFILILVGVTVMPVIGALMRKAETQSTARQTTASDSSSSGRA